MYYVYILKLKNNTYYTGHTADLEDRLKKHCNFDIPQTKDLHPIKLVFYCAFSTKLKALAFERFLKTPSGKIFRNKLLI